MTTYMSDTFWRYHPRASATAWLPWLHDRGSLTRRLQQRCRRFQVTKVYAGLAKIAYDEARLLNISTRRLAYSREVFLLADGVPVVFAHSCCAQEYLRGEWGAVAGLGQRPLGELLFTHPQVQRLPLHYKLLRASDPLYQRAIQYGCEAKTLWARRSLFYLHQAPLLVTEVFLPEVLQLRC